MTFRNGRTVLAAAAVLFGACSSTVSSRVVDRDAQSDGSDGSLSGSGGTGGTGDAASSVGGTGAMTGGAAGGGGSGGGGGSSGGGGTGGSSASGGLSGFGGSGGSFGGIGGTSGIGGTGGAPTCSSGGCPPPPTNVHGCAGCILCEKPWLITWTASPGAEYYVVGYVCVAGLVTKDVGNVTSVDLCVAVGMCNDQSCANGAGAVTVQACNANGCSDPVQVPSDETPTACGGGNCC